MVNHRTCPSVFFLFHILRSECNIYIYSMNVTARFLITTYNILRHTKVGIPASSLQCISKNKDTVGLSGFPSNRTQWGKFLCCYGREYPPLIYRREFLQPHCNVSAKDVLATLFVLHIKQSRLGSTQRFCAWQACSWTDWHVMVRVLSYELPKQCQC